MGLYLLFIFGMLFGFLVTGDSNCLIAMSILCMALEICSMTEVIRKK